jgi:aspartate/methionine/tyrosine aminotransferase
LKRLERDLDKLENLIDKDTRMIILNNPTTPQAKSQTLNPDGIVDIANKKASPYSDEAYGQ